MPPPSCFLSISCFLQRQVDGSFRNFQKVTANRLLRHCPNIGGPYSRTLREEMWGNFISLGSKKVTSRSNFSSLPSFPRWKCGNYYNGNRGLFSCVELPSISWITQQRFVTFSNTQKTESFYKRPLPPHLISFSSAEGKKLFKEALEKGIIESYWKLAEQFHTQSEPACLFCLSLLNMIDCGLATLAMVLNALQIDPQRVWKGPWRWFSEDLLDCCVPLEVFRFILKFYWIFRRW